MPIDVLLLLALPASGKSELRRYLDSLPAQVLLDDFGLGPTVQLDDYPYVHLMRRISAEQESMGLTPSFFPSPEGPFRDGRDWATLIHLINEDFHHLAGASGAAAAAPGESLLGRLSVARMAAGADPEIVPEPKRNELARRIDADAASIREAGPAPIPGSTIVIEFARGGPQGSTMPLEPPHGYEYSLSHLSARILERARILYVWVDPEESRRRNRERARPDGDASILHHGVPESVMRSDYGCDDIDWLMSRSAVAGTIEIGDHHLPIARFDNRSDKTSFLRDDNWPPDLVDALHAELRGVFANLT